MYTRAYPPSSPGLESDVELRVIGIDGTGGRILVPRSKISPEPLDWSPDGDTLAVMFQGSPTPERSQLALVSVADGAVRDLKTFETADLEWCADSHLFSPDGQYFAYSAGTRNEPCDVFALSSDGSGERRLVQNPANDHFVAWTPSGRGILFRSDRSGTDDLWLVHVVNGRTDGPPERVRADVGSFLARGMTSAGALYFQAPGPHRLQGGDGFDLAPDSDDIYIAQLDPATGTLTSPPAPIAPSHEGLNHSPTWSADGRYLVYRTRDSRSLVWDTITILSMETGEERHIRPDIPNSLAQQAVWMLPDDRRLVALITSGGDGKRLCVIDAQTGAISVVGEVRGSEMVLVPGTEDVIYKTTANAIIRRSLKRDDERTLYTAGEGEQLTSLAVSSDGQQMTFRQNANGVTRIVVMPMAGGPPREVYESHYTAVTHRSVWSPDGRFIYFVERPQQDIPAWELKEDLWRVPAAGGPAEKMGLSTDGFTVWNPAVDPSGRYIAFAEEHYLQDPTEWVLDHFLPAIELQKPIAGAR